MKIQRETTVAFTGHRTYDCSCDEAIREAVRRWYGEGFRTFMTGMAAGFDLAAGECVAGLKGELPGLRLHCVVPFAGHKVSLRSRWSSRYERLLEQADEVTELLPRYAPQAYHRRNDFLVENSSVLIAWFDGTRGGTEYTVRKGQREGLRIDNLWLGLFETVTF